MYVHALAFTGNVLLVWGNRELVAWRLTEKRIVVSASADKRADRGNSIWTVSTSGLMFLVEGQTVAIKDDERNIIHVYHTGTGEVLAPAQVSPYPRARQYSPKEMYRCQHYLRYRNLLGPGIPSEGEWPIRSCSYLGRDANSDDPGENERSERLRTLSNTESHLLVGRTTSLGRLWERDDREHA